MTLPEAVTSRSSFALTSTLTTIFPSFCFWVLLAVALPSYDARIVERMPV